MPYSFKSDGHLRPSSYRTPSPPQHAIEPLSPYGSSAPQGWHLQGQALDSKYSDQDDAIYHLPSSKPHDLSGERELTGNVHIYAGIPATRIKRNLRRSPPLEQPYKRARLERLPSLGLMSDSLETATRPLCSYKQTEPDKLSEAELLLHFSQVARVQMPFSIKSCRWISQDSLVSAEHHMHCEQNTCLTDIEKGRLVKLLKIQESPPYLREQPSARRSDSAARQAPDVDVPGRNPDLMNENLTTKSCTSPTETPADLWLLERDKCESSQQSPSADIHVRDSIDTSKRSICHVLEGEAPVSEGCFIKPTTRISDRLKNDVDTMSVKKFDVKSVNDRAAPSLPITRSTPEKHSRSSDVTAVCKACNFSRNSSGIEGEFSSTSWISCDGCKEWFHFACAGFKNEREVRVVDKFRCKLCRPLHGGTTYVRKSSRAHSAIDYAGLHQGVIKTSDEKMEHHYIQPIREGVITFLPETFARMQPELVTADFFEKGGGMKEPIVIPAALNPRPNYFHSLGCGERLRTNVEQCILSSEELNTPATAMSDLESQIVEDEGQDALGMILPLGLSVRHVAKLYGEEEKVEVIDVKSQNGENKRWNMKKWADYYENSNDKIVRNVISLEVSQSRLGRLIRRPKVVRDLDLQDSVWPEEQVASGEYPRVQFYCLMSVANCFTDFHIDFGGSSVFYHILKGKKTFLFIPPKEKHLKKYEEWCMSPAQNWTFLADQTKECYRVDLSEGDTMLIPSGWIHAVWTPEDSLVIGGNFLTRMNFGMQLRIAQLEKSTGVARKFRYPSFQKLHWYTAFQYLDRDPLPEDIKRRLHNGEVFHRACPTSNLFDAWGENSLPGIENYHARYYSQSELDGLPELTRYLLRTALIDCGSVVEGITAEVRNAVKRSIPRSHGEPLDVIKKFAAWCAWKRGNEPIPHWAYPNAEPKTMMNDKLSATTIRKLDREAALEAALRAPRRQSARMQAQQSELPILSETVSCESTCDDQSMLQAPKQIVQIESGPKAYTEVPDPSKSPKQDCVLTSSNSLNRKTACEACRKRRRACKHKPLSYDKSTTDLSKSSEQGNTGTNNMAMEGLNIPTMSDAVREIRIPVGSPAYAHASSPRKSLEAAIDYKEEREPSREKQSLETVSGNAVHSRSRTKACHDCRKSKRRCVHDASGNEDPIKLAEQIIPRPHARKAHKGDTQLTRQSLMPHVDTSSILDLPKMMAPVASMKPIGRRHIPSRGSFVEDKWDLALGHNESLASFSASPGSITASSVTSLDEQHEANSALREVSIVGQDDRGQEQAGRTEDSNSASSTLISSTTIGQPLGNASLMSPPASSHDDIGSSPINTAENCSPSPPTSRYPSQQPHSDKRQQYTPESNTLQNVKSKSRSQPSDEMPTRRWSSAQKYLTKFDQPLITDEKSLQLIKELQAQDLGLRKRGRVL